MQPAIIYNLFPRLVGPMPSWLPHVERAKQMGFNWIYINPFHYPGFSGSLYAPKDYYEFNPLFLDPKSKKKPFDQLKKFIKQAKKMKMKLMMDLVINHTAVDSILVDKHKDWYKWEKNGKIKNPSCFDPEDARKVTVWGDLAEIDNDTSPDKKNLWKYWLDLCLFFEDLGFDGYRADAAYHVPVELWDYLISAAKKKNKDFQFFAETLGCKEKDIVALAKVGFDYIYNSSKWWNLKDDWCLRQYDASRKYSPSISFAETHDTPRLAKEVHGNLEVIKQRYLFSALFSKGVMMPIGFEYGFKKKTDVVHTQPDWWEKTGVNLSDYITRVNKLKSDYKIFQEDNELHFIQSNPNHNCPAFIKISKNGKEKVILIINTDDKHHHHINLNLPSIFQSKNEIKDLSIERKIEGKIEDDFHYYLNPSEVRVLYLKV